MVLGGVQFVKLLQYAVFSIFPLLPLVYPQVFFVTKHSTDDKK